MVVKIHSYPDWLLHYERKSGLWVGFHRDRPWDEWNAYTKDELLWNIGHHEIPGFQRDVTKQIVKR